MQDESQRMAQENLRLQEALLEAQQEMGALARELAALRRYVTIVVRLFNHVMVLIEQFVVHWSKSDTRLNKWETRQIRLKVHCSNSWLPSANEQRQRRLDTVQFNLVMCAACFAYVCGSQNSNAHLQSEMDELRGKLRNFQVGLFVILML
jgi:hypothetical protein